MAVAAATQAVLVDKRVERTAVVWVLEAVVVVCWAVMVAVEAEAAAERMALAKVMVPVALAAAAQLVAVEAVEAAAHQAGTEVAVAAWALGWACMASPPELQVAQSAWASEVA